MSQKRSNKMQIKFSAIGLVLLIVLAVSMGCRGKPAAPDPTSRFSEPGSQRTRELGVYSDQIRVGDITFTSRDGKWDQTIPVKELTESVTLRLSFRGDEFEMSSHGSSWIDEELGLLANVSEIKFGLGGVEDHDGEKRAWCLPAGAGDRRFGGPGKSHRS